MPDKTPTVVCSRLSKHAYSQLTRGCVPINQVPKTDLEAAFACGMEHVLRKLREGFVMDNEE